MLRVNFATEESKQVTNAMNTITCVIASPERLVVSLARAKSRGEVEPSEGRGNLKPIQQTLQRPQNLPQNLYLIRFNFKRL